MRGLLGLFDTYERTLQKTRMSEVILFKATKGLLEGYCTAIRVNRVTRVVRSSTGKRMGYDVLYIYI